MAGITRRTFIFATMAGLLVLGIVPEGRVQAQNKPLNLVATTSMIADSLRQVGGDRVDVKALMGPGIDPHTYRQTRSDIAAMTRADAVFWHGLYLEAQLEEFFKTLDKHRDVVAIAETLPKSVLRSHDSYEGRYDPHVWMNPLLWREIVAAIKTELIRLDPDGASFYEANAKRHIAEIDALAVYTGKVTASVPNNARVLVTAHDAFNYFGEAFDFEVLGIQGISTESEAGLNRVETLVQTLVERKIGAIFVESSVSDRNVKALVEGAAAKGHQVIIGGELFSDAMGTPGSYEGTYIGMIDHNATVIARALGGDVPAKGMNGKLALIN